MDNADISVVIPVKNGQKRLDSVLKGVFSQEINSRYEVVIIDSASKDATLDIVKRYPVKLYSINEGEFNHGLTRNLGISKSQGKYVILLSQDAVPLDKTWMVKLIKNLDNDDGIAGVYSRQEPHADCGILAKARVKRFFTSERQRRESKINCLEDYSRLSPKEKYHFCNFDNVSSCIRKSVWERMPFPETDFAEDLAWSKNVLERGYKIVYEPDSAVYHSHEFSINEWYRRNKISFSKLSLLFGTDGVDTVIKLLAFSFVYALKDFYFACRHRSRLTDFLTSFYLIPFFSVSAALGQYKGIKDSRNFKKTP